MALEENEVKKLIEDNRNFQLEIEKLTDELTQLKELISSLVNNTIIGAF